jgi:hypothetical protein
MYYHAAVLLLFRPFLRAKFTESSIAPAELCRQAATSLSDLFARHLSLYGATGVYTFHLQGLLAACTIHLINLPAIASATALTAAARALAALVHRNAWAAAALRLIRALVRRWGIVVPGELEAALYSDAAAGEDEDVDVSTERGGGGRAEGRRPLPRELRRRQAPKRPATAAGGSSSSSSGAAGGDNGGGPGGRLTAAAGPSASRSGAAATTAAAVPKRQRLASRGGRKNAAESSDDSDAGELEAPPLQQQPLPQPNINFLFAPFPSQQPAPLLGPIHTSTTPDPDLEWGEEEVRRVTRDFDGLRFEGDGWFDPFMGI